MWGWDDPHTAVVYFCFSRRPSVNGRWDDLAHCPIKVRWVRDRVAEPRLLRRAEELDKPLNECLLMAGTTGERERQAARVDSCNLARPTALRDDGLHHDDHRLRLVQLQPPSQRFNASGSMAQTLGVGHAVHRHRAEVIEVKPLLLKESHKRVPVTARGSNTLLKAR